MPQIINENPNFGSLLGTGLSSGLNVLAQNKLNQFAGRQQRQMTAQGLAALGIPEQEAMQISSLPEKLQELVVKNYLSAAEGQGLNQALAALSGEPQQQQQPGIQQFYQQAAPQQNPQLSALQNLISSGKGITPEAFGQQLSAQGAQAPQQAAPIESPKMAERAKSFAETLRTARISPEHKLKLAAMQQSNQLHKEKLSAKEREIVDKETKPIYDEISKGAKSAQNNNKRLDRMEVLINEGKLNGPALVGLLDNLGGIGSAIGGVIGLITGGKFGGGIGAAAGAGVGGIGNTFLSPQSQEFNKLSNDFLKDAKDTFGSRLTNYDVQTFLATVPTLSQSDEGKRRVITNLRSFNEAALLRNKAMNQIIKDNGGKRPANLDTLIEERIAPQLDALAEKFKKGEGI
jgi:hypothetical protein